MALRADSGDERGLAELTNPKSVAGLCDQPTDHRAPGPGQLAKGRLGATSDVGRSRWIMHRRAESARHDLDKLWRLAPAGRSDVELVGAAMTVLLELYRTDAVTLRRRKRLEKFNDPPAQEASP
jgi:hypothetical protein